MKNFFGFTFVSQSGGTLIELLVGIVVVGILATGATVTLSRHRDNRVFDYHLQATLGLLNKARAKAVTAENASDYGVHFESDRAVLFIGENYSALDPNNEVFEFDSAVELTTLALAGGGDAIVFDAVVGDTQQDGSLTLQLPNGGLEKSISVSPLGVIQAD